MLKLNYLLTRFSQFKDLRIQFKKLTDQFKDQFKKSTDQFLTGKCRKNPFGLAKWYQPADGTFRRISKNPPEGTIRRLNPPDEPNGL